MCILYIYIYIYIYTGLQGPLVRDGKTAVRDSCTGFTIISTTSTTYISNKHKTSMTIQLHIQSFVFV